MADRQIDGYKNFLNKNVFVFYNDIPEHVTNSNGKLIFIDDQKVILEKTDDGQIIIPLIKIIRIEVKG